MAEKKTGGVKKKVAATSGKQTKKKPVTKPAKKKPVKETKATPKRKESAAQVIGRKDRMSDVYTEAGTRLTIKEAKFIDSYIAHGNIRQAAIDAGYKCGSDRSFAGQIGTELLEKPYIKAEIDARMRNREKKSIADREEIMQFWTDMMRGKILDQFDMPTTNSDKLKAATELAKRGMDIEDRIREKKEAGTAPEIRISLKWDEEQAT